MHKRDDFFISWLRSKKDESKVPDLIQKSDAPNVSPIRELNNVEKDKRNSQEEDFYSVPLVYL